MKPWRNGRLATVMTAALFCVGRTLAAQTMPPESARGFAPNSVFATSGLDTVNVYSGNVLVSVPVGPEYPIGSALSHQLRLTYNSKLWNVMQGCLLVSGTSPQYAIGYYLSGPTAVGPGWSIELGHVRGSTSSSLVYVGPDGSEHATDPQGYSDDGSFLKFASPTYDANGNLKSAIVYFPDGRKATFGQQIRPGDINHSSAPGDFIDSAGAYLTRLEDRYGDYLEATYNRFFDGSLHLWQVRHYARNTTSGVDLLRTLKFGYTTVNGWSMLTDIWLPAVGDTAAADGSRNVKLSYVTTSTYRPGQDSTGSCPDPAARSSVLIQTPFLANVDIGSALTPSQPQLAYQFAYFLPQTDARTDSGALMEMTVPTGGVVQYTWSKEFATPVPNEPPPPTPPPAICNSDNIPDCSALFRRNTAGILTRSEFPDGKDANGRVIGTGNTWTYGRDPGEGYQFSSVTAPDGYSALHTFHTEPSTSGNRSGGLEYQVDYRDQAGNTVRRISRCYQADTLAGDLCGTDSNFHFLHYNIRETLTSESTISGQTALQTRRTARSLWDGYGHFGKIEIYGWDGGLLRTEATTWAANYTDWVLNLYSRRTSTEGSSKVDQFADFDYSTGFLKGTLIWDGSTGLRSCRYAGSAGTVDREFSDTGSYAQAPAGSFCPATPPAGKIGIDGDAFGKVFTYKYGLLLTSQWFRDASTSPLAWYLVNQTRDVATGLVLTSTASDGLLTKTDYDALGRVKQVTPPGGEAATVAIYDSPRQVTVTRNGTGGLTTSEQYLYDGFGRLSREIRQMPSLYAMRLHSYDAVGRASFVSEWVVCGSLASCDTLTPTYGTTSSNFDPFGRAQRIRRADGSTSDISYDDGSAVFSDTLKRETVHNLNGRCVAGSCSGGADAATTSRYDALGRLLKVVEPDNYETAYTYDVNGRLTSVTQPPQAARKFDYDAFGFLRAQTTPEGGKVTYDLYGSLGNLRKSTKPGAKPTDPNVVITQSYDAAGRVTSVSSDEGGSRSYIANTYDLSAPIGLGKLGSRTTYNYSLLPDAATVADTYSYDAATGRTASRRTVIARNGATLLDTTQRWLYNSLGLPAVHFHPRPVGATPFAVTTSYTAGLPTSMTANGLPVLASASYAPSGALTSYVLGQGTGHNFTTTIRLDDYLPRPVQISTSGASQVFDTKTYYYDGAGNIVQMGNDGASPDKFVYDSDSRLLSSTLLLPSGAYTTQGYSYDRYGNLKSKGVFTYDVDTATNRLVSRLDTSKSTTVAATYDPRGNLTDFGAQHDEFDGLDHLTRHTAPSADWRYLYDGSAERVARMANAGGSPYYSFRDEGNRLVTEYQGSNWSRDNVYLGGLLIASLSECSYSGSPDWSFWASDHLGSVRQQVGTDGKSYDLRKYWPFGDDTQGAVDQGLNHPQRLGFAGMERDNEAPRFYDHARSHDFSIGRFSSPDRLGGSPADPQSWNRYAYARNNPLTRIDLSGLDDYYFQRAYAQLSASTDQIYRSLNQLRVALIFELGLGPGGGIKVHAPGLHGEVGGFVGLKWSMGSGLKYSASGDAKVTAGGKTVGEGVEFSGKLDRPIESMDLQAGLRGNGGSQLNTNFSQEGFEGAELSAEGSALGFSLKVGVQDPAAVAEAAQGFHDAFQSALGGFFDFTGGVSDNLDRMIRGQPTMTLAPCDGKEPCRPAGRQPPED